MHWLVGVNGERTPDPQYWRDRNEIIEAETKKEAIAKWKEEHQYWYCGEPISAVQMSPNLPEHERYFASRWKFENNEPIRTNS